MQEKVSFEDAPGDMVTIVKIKFEDGLQKGAADCYDWRLRLDSTRGNIQDQLNIWEIHTMNTLKGVAPGGFILKCSDWVISPKLGEASYDSCCAILISVESKDPTLSIHLRGDGTKPCSIQ